MFTAADGLQHSNPPGVGRVLTRSWSGDSLIRIIHIYNRYQWRGHTYPRKRSLHRANTPCLVPGGPSRPKCVEPTLRESEILDATDPNPSVKTSPDVSDMPMVPEVILNIILEYARRSSLIEDDVHERYRERAEEHPVPSR